jgi:thiol-disulfide isomerase/thioredoxin
MAPEARGTWLLLLASALVCALGVVCCSGAELQRWTAGRQLPFTLPSTNGADVALDSVRGQVVLVHFFATWCEPCREELPALNRLAARANGTVKVLAIAVGEVKVSVRRFIETTPVNYSVLLDHERAVASAWTLPTTFVLDADLRPRLVVETEFAWDSIDPGKFPDVFTRAPTEREIAESPSNRLHRGG